MQLFLFAVNLVHLSTKGSNSSILHEDQSIGKKTNLPLQQYLPQGDFFGILASGTIWGGRPSAQLRNLYGHGAPRSITTDF
jgi:hypothetical protein